MKLYCKLLLSLVLIIGVLVSGCVKQTVVNGGKIFSQDKYIECNNYLTGENDRIFQSFNLNISTISSLTLRATTTNDVEISISILRNRTGEEIFGINKKIKKSSDKEFDVDMQGLLVEPNETYLLKLTCLNCVHKIGIPENNMFENKIVCFSYANQNHFNQGAYSYYGVGFESDDPNLDLTFRLKGK